MEEGLEVTFQSFMQEDQILRDRLIELMRGRGDDNPEPVSKQEVNSLKSVITFQQGKAPTFLLLRTLVWTNPHASLSSHRLTSPHNAPFDVLHLAPIRIGC